MKLNGKNFEQPCKYLGIFKDPDTCFSFPNQMNCCNKVKKPENIKISHQENFCLSSNPERCAIYKESNPRHLPNNIVGEILVKERLKLPQLLVFSFGLIVFVSILTINLLNLNQNGTLFAFSTKSPIFYYTPTPSELPMPTFTSVEIDMLAEFPTETDGPIKTEITETDSPTKTEITGYSTATFGPGITTPFGNEKQYLIHQVRPGESLHYIADLYNTSLEALLGINSLIEGYPIWVNQIIIVSPGTTQGPYEKLDAITLKEDTMLQSIADNYSTTIIKLIELNDFGEIYTIPIGRWVIVPHK